MISTFPTVYYLQLHFGLLCTCRFYGVALAASAMMATTVQCIDALDRYLTMQVELPNEYQKRCVQTDILDSVGNTTATGKVLLSLQQR
jgi:Na+/H+-translocating membrane pyrophosphatase